MLVLRPLATPCSLLCSLLTLSLQWVEREIIGIRFVTLYTLLVPILGARLHPPKTITVPPLLRSQRTAPLLLLRGDELLTIVRTRLVPLTDVCVCLTLTRLIPPLALCRLVALTRRREIFDT